MFTGVQSIKMVARLTLYIQLFAWVLLALAGCGGGNIPVASVLSSGRITLSWNDVPGAASYELYISTSPGITTLNSYKIADVTSPITITDLEPGTTYYFMVVVFSDSGESRTSKEVAYTVSATEGAIEFGDLFTQSELVEKSRPAAEPPVSTAAEPPGAGQQTRPQAVPIPVKKAGSGAIMCFGDSLTAGTGASAGMDYPSQLARMIGKPVINKGVPGDTTSSALRRLNRDVLSANPDIVLITLGGNDLKNGVARNTAFSNLKYIVETLQKRGIRVIIGGLKFPGNDRGFAKGYQDLAQQTGVTLIPNIFEGIFDNLDLMSDAIHPNDAGYRIIARRFQNALAPAQKAAETSRKTTPAVAAKAAAPVATAAAPTAEKEITQTQNVTLAWDDDSKVDYYNVYWSDDRNFSQETSGKEKSTTKLYTIQNLEKGKLYFFKVTGVNQAGEGPPSEILEYRVGE